jgi:hypothetical protein
MPNEPDPNDAAVRFEAEQQQLLEEQAQDRAHRGIPPGHVRLMAPNGLAIDGTCENVQGCATACVYLEPDGTVYVDHTGYTEMYWESSETEVRAGQTVYQDVEGNEWLENELVPDPSYDGSDEE